MHQALAMEDDEEDEEDNDDLMIILYHDKAWAKISPFHSKDELSTLFNPLMACGQIGKERGLSAQKMNLLHPPAWHGKYENNEEDEERFVTTGFCLNVVLGFVIGFWGFFCPNTAAEQMETCLFQILAKDKRLDLCDSSNQYG
ncbi:hypothetical protein LguiB_013112 [Lonicera macranthoides]